jgi:hypothetical protein
MPNILVWLYLINTVLLIVHEIDSAYWHEWKLFKLPGEITGFLLIHIPLVLIILWGLLELSGGTLAGIIMSLVLAVAGIFAFSIHIYFMRTGHGEFKTPTSIIILTAILCISGIQLVVALMQLFL